MDNPVIQTTLFSRHWTKTKQTKNTPYKNIYQRDITKNIANIGYVFQSYWIVITGKWSIYNLICFLLVTTCPRYKSHFTRFVTRVTRRVPLVEQELPTLPEHLSLSPVFSVARYLVFCVVFCRSLLVIFLLSLFCLYSFDLRILITSSNSEKPGRGVSYLYRPNQLLNAP
jgi:hypothetical protein